jgi:hypothetical protein
MLRSIAALSRSVSPARLRQVHLVFGLQRMPMPRGLRSVSLAATGLLAVAALLAAPEAKAGWLTACKPCLDAMEECREARKGDVSSCISEANAKCSQCADSIKSARTIYCEESIQYHALVCDSFCRGYEGPVGSYGSGKCNVFGKCDCSE